ncbi:multifunctional CCA addition/repair protein [Ectothiorhodospiraceae bacterium WFHF3C12]|nr:multifunctional CCA addition/repair protein [Ectothiorhodospiraceae bacterium WFHF3C12]
MTSSANRPTAAEFDTYLVGGAVRDRRLGRPVHERDWVVVGATPEAMRAAGFKPVGKDFPVFLHPETGEEYALARTERKTAPGYHGFEFHASPQVTLEEDLARRDLTINAMAETPEGDLVDPYGGAADLDARLLRHVSPAFAEDPVRILRLARFAARFRPLGFTVAEETMALCRQMVADGEVDALVAERVWQELARALMEDRPDTFIRVLRDCGALARILPEVDRLFGVPQPEQYHPEVDTGEHILLVLQRCAALQAPLEVRFAALVHDLGKGLTPGEELPSHVGHEERGLEPVKGLCERLRTPRACRDLALHVTREHLNCHRALELRPAKVVDLLQRLDVFRKPDRLERFLLACQADAQGRTGLEERPYPQADFLRRAHEAAAGVDAGPFVEQGLQGPAIKAAMREEQIRRVKALKDMLPANERG